MSRTNYHRIASNPLFNFTNTHFSNQPNQLYIICSSSFLFYRDDSPALQKEQLSHLLEYFFLFLFKYTAPHFSRHLQVSYIQLIKKCLIKSWVLQYSHSSHFFMSVFLKRILWCKDKCCIRFSSKEGLSNLRSRPLQNRFVYQCHISVSRTH